MGATSFVKTTGAAARASAATAAGAAAKRAPSATDPTAIIFMSFSLLSETHPYYHADRLFRVCDLGALCRERRAGGVCGYHAPRRAFDVTRRANDVRGDGRADGGG